MHTTTDLLDALAEKLGGVSDYRLAKILNTSTSNITAYRKGRSRLSVEFAFRVAQHLDWDAAYVVACVEAERAEQDSRLEHTQEIVATWARIAAKFRPALPSILLAALAMFGLMLLPHHVEASEIFGPRSARVASPELRDNKDSVKWLMRRLRAWLAALLTPALQMNLRLA